MTVRLNDAQAKALGLDGHIPKRVARPGGMNGLERRYAGWLDEQKRRGEVRRYWYEAVKLRLAGKTFFTPDFLVEMADWTLECHEVKGGFIRDDAIVKLKVAAEHMPFVFHLCQWTGGGWKISRVGGKK